MHVIIAIIFGVVITIYLVQMLVSYLSMANKAGTWKDHLWAAAWGSATKLWAKAVGIVTSGIALLANSGVVQSPQLEALIRQINPAYATAIIAGLGVVVMIVVEKARGRTLN